MRRDDPTDIVIRDSVPGDAETVERLRVETWKAAYRGVVPDAFLDQLTGDVELRRRKIIERQDTAVDILAQRGDDVVGWLSGGPSRDDDQDPESVGEIYSCYITVEYWRKGIGRRLMAAALAAPALAHRSRTTLWVLRDNTPACRFYEFVGFRMDGAERVLDLGGPVPEIRYAAPPRRLIPIAGDRPYPW